MTTTKSEWRQITEKEADRLIDRANDEGASVTFMVPGECRGQIVERAYAGVGQYGIMERVTDRGDRTVSYSIRDWRDDDEDTPGLNYIP